MSKILSLIGFILLSFSTAGYSKLPNESQNNIGKESFKIEDFVFRISPKRVLQIAFAKNISKNLRIIHPKNLRDGENSFFVHVDGKQISQFTFDFDPSRLCFKDGVYEDWSFYRGSYSSLSVVSSQTVIIGQPDLRNSSICGKVKIEGNVLIVNSRIEGWGAPEGFFSIKGISNQVYIYQSTLTGKMNFNTDFTDGITGLPSSTQIYVYDSTINGNPSVEGGFNFQESTLNGNGNYSGSVLFFSGSEIVGNHNISAYNGDHFTAGGTKVSGSLTSRGSVEIDKSDFKGSSVFDGKGMKVKLYDVTIDGSPTITKSIYLNEVDITDAGYYEGSSFRGEASRIGKTLLDRILLEGANHFKGYYDIRQNLKGVTIDTLEYVGSPNTSPLSVGVSAYISEGVELFGTLDIQNSTVETGVVIESVYEASCGPCRLTISSSTISGADTNIKGLMFITNSFLNEVNLNLGGYQEEISGRQYSLISYSTLTNTTFTGWAKVPDKILSGGSYSGHTYCYPTSCISVP